MPLDRTQAPEARNIEHFSLLPVSSAKLSNQVPFIYLSGGSQPVLNLQIIIEAGRLNEKVPGQATFVAKMLGEGTRNYNSQQLSEFFDRHGAFWSANSGTDWIGLDFYCLSKHLESLLPVITEIAAYSVFLEHELENAKNISLQQLKVNLEKVSYLASTSFKAQLYGKHAYGYSIDAPIINSMNTDMLASFFADNYHAGNMTIFLSGQISEEHIKAIDNTLGQLPMKPKGLSVPPQLPPTAFSKLYVERPEALQSSIRIGKRLFHRNHPDELAFQVLNTVLGSYFGSRLMQNIREEKGLSYGIYSSTSFMKHDGFFFISSDVQKAQCGLALEEIYKEIDILCHTPIEEEELHLVKNYIAGSIVKSVESPTSIINYHKTAWQYQLPEGYYDSYLQQMWALTPEELMAIAQKYLSGDFIEVVAG